MQRETALRQMIRESFPGNRYQGRIMANLPASQEHDFAEHNLDQVPYGRDRVSPDFLSGECPLSLPGGGKLPHFCFVALQISRSAYLVDTIKGRLWPMWRRSCRST
jgi:hypothetical protein